MKAEYIPASLCKVRTVGLRGVLGSPVQGELAKP